MCGVVDYVRAHTSNDTTINCRRRDQRNDTRTLSFDWDDGVLMIIGERHRVTQFHTLTCHWTIFSAHIEQLRIVNCLSRVPASSEKKQTRN